MKSWQSSKPPLCTVAKLKKSLRLRMKRESRKAAPNHADAGTTAAESN